MKTIKRTDVTETVRSMLSEREQLAEVGEQHALSTLCSQLRRACLCSTGFRETTAELVIVISHLSLAETQLIEKFFQMKNVCIFPGSHAFGDTPTIELSGFVDVYPTWGNILNGPSVHNYNL
jgi:hypothetical protein